MKHLLLLLLSPVLIAGGLLFSAGLLLLLICSSLFDQLFRPAKARKDLLEANRGKYRS